MKWNESVKWPLTDVDVGHVDGGVAQGVQRRQRRRAEEGREETVVSVGAVALFGLVEHAVTIFGPFVKHPATWQQKKTS